MPSRKLSSYWMQPTGTLLCALSLFALNVYICLGLFGLEFSTQMESIEGSYMSISRWAMDNWRDLTWFPLWFGGVPFHKVYQPGFHLSVAALAGLLRWTPQHAFHFLAAIAYCAGPVTRWALCYTMTKSRAYGFFAGLLYSLLSPACLLGPFTRADVGGAWLPRRYQVLVHYGEAPHLAAVALIPVVILVLHGAVTLRRRIFVMLAPAALAAVALTNWPGTIGLSLGIGAYFLSRAFDKGAVHWPTFAAVVGVAYLVAIPWIPPSAVLAVFGNAQHSDYMHFGRQQLFPALLVLAALALLLAMFQRWRVEPWVRFFAFYALLTGAVSMGHEWFNWKLLPQPQRFQLEFDLTFVAMLAWFLMAGFGKLTRGAQVAALAVAAILVVAQTRHTRRYAREITNSIDITTTTEYRMSKWFAAHMNGARVFAPGNVSLWMNLFTDVPQMAGCCDQSVPDFEDRIADYTIYSGQNAGARDAEYSVLWLTLYGADAVGVTGPKSSEPIKPFRNPEKFSGVLPELWRDGDNRVYRVPRKAADPVRVIPKAALAVRAPADGLDVQPVLPLVKALEDPALPSASFRWLNRHEAAIDAVTQPGQVIFLQISHDRGWRAEQNGMALPIVRDPLGLMYIQPIGSGPAHIRLVYDGGTEAELARMLFGFGIAAWLMLARFYR